MMMVHEWAMHEALHQAKQYAGSCAPNPAVGAVLISANRCIAKGAHQGVGSPHAERVALSLVEIPKEAVLYVTLEPCAHQGRTPPCVEAIIASGVRTVVYGLGDPDCRVSGEGVRRLREAGCVVEQCLLPEIERFYRPYCYWQRTKAPYFVAKIAMSLDAKIANVDKTPAAITPCLREWVHEHRRMSDAIFTSGETLRRDNPRFNVRLGDQALHKPIVILSLSGALSPDLRVFSQLPEVPVWLFHGREANVSHLAALGVKCVPIQAEDHWQEVRLTLGQSGYHRVWCEVGHTLWQWGLQHAFWQEAYVCVGPLLLGENAYPKQHESSGLSNYRLLESQVREGCAIWHFGGGDG